MKLRLTVQAASDLTEIADYIRAKNPAAALRVRESIIESQRILTEFPAAGRRQNIEGVRKLVTRRYSYAVYYAVWEKEDEVVVLAIQHPARKPAPANL